MADEILTISGTGKVQLIFPRRWFHLFKFGWHRHETLFGRRCWIRYNWTAEDEQPLRSRP